MVKPDDLQRLPVRFGQAFFPWRRGDHLQKRGGKNMKSFFNFTMFTVVLCVVTPFLCAMESCENDVNEVMEEEPDGVEAEITIPIDEAGQTTMVLIPAGEFQMGSNDAPDPEVWLREVPVHTVFTDAFYMDRREVTNADYQKFVLANPDWQKENIAEADMFYLTDWNGNNYPIVKAEHPVTHVNWYAAMAYAAWVGKRLPTEAEWEKAARGGLVGKKYPWGDTISATDCNYNYNIGETTPVGKYRANGYGLYDIAGNVWEWCLDAGEEDFYSRSPVRNPLAGVAGDTLLGVNELTSNFMEVKTVRVLRGGSMYSPEASTEVTTRAGKGPQSSLGSVGFRCVKPVSR